MAVNLLQKNPLWTEQNKKHSPVICNWQVFCYFQNIRQPTARDAVVCETLKRNET